MAQPAKIVIPAAVEKRYEIQDEIARWVDVAAIRTELHCESYAYARLSLYLGSARCRMPAGVHIIVWAYRDGSVFALRILKLRFLALAIRRHTGIIARKALQN